MIFYFLNRSYICYTYQRDEIDSSKKLYVEKGKKEFVCASENRHDQTFFEQSSVGVPVGMVAVICT